MSTSVEVLDAVVLVAETELFVAAFEGIMVHGEGLGAELLLGGAIADVDWYWALDVLIEGVDDSAGFLLLDLGTISVEDDIGVLAISASINNSSTNVVTTCNWGCLELGAESGRDAEKSSCEFHFLFLIIDSCWPIAYIALSCCW